VAYRGAEEAQRDSFALSHNRIAVNLHNSAGPWWQSRHNGLENLLFNSAVDTLTSLQIHGSSGTIIARALC
jgi:hypothetical protein